MLSAIFVDRPRLAIVIAIVTTIAGLLALATIPIAQYPDIVPPQVSVTTTYPGANSSVVEATVAQVIEAQVVGVQAKGDIDAGRGRMASDVRERLLTDAEGSGGEIALEGDVA